MKTVTIPFLINNKERAEELFSETTLNVFRKVKADRIALVFSDYKNQTENCRIVKRAIGYFGEYDMEVAVWSNSLLHIDVGEGFTKKKYASGKEMHWCPLDGDFRLCFAKHIAEYAKTGVRLIFLDDDFRISASGGLSCFCDKHMKRYKELLGEGASAKEIAEGILTGKPNKYRTAWSKVNGEALKAMASAIRQEVDKADPTVRVGLCAAPSTMFLVDGVSAFELSEILAGKTKPFLRAIGAPYWSYFAKDYWRARLSDIIGLERLEARFAELCGFKGEFISEGDTFPRPRYATPASFLELFHSALCAENGMDGILKYIGEYTGKGSYETGYSRLAASNAEKTGKIASAFAGTEKCGYRIVEVQNKMLSMEYKGEDVEFIEHGGGIPASVRALNDASIPYTFSGSEPCAAFGDNARYLTAADIKCGVLTDITGALILKEKGTDVGLDSCIRFMPVTETTEIYPEFNDGEYVNFNRSVDLYDIRLKSGAEVLTFAKVGEKEIPLTYRYENGGVKIAVCCADASDARFSHGYFKSYYKQRVLADIYKWFTGESLAAVCFDCPMLMPIVGKKQGKTVVGLWNIFEDKIFEQKIELSKEYTKAEFIGCSGKLEGNTLILHDLAAFDYCAVVLC